VIEAGMRTKIKAVAAGLLMVVTGAFWGYAGGPAGTPGFVIPVPNAPGVAVNSNKKAVIDYSNAKDGYVMVKYLQNTKKKLKAIV
jgi:hypothetical protein